ncbi:3-deoxy-7-phosphoheptulonate synthase [Kitasatospora sp. NPDC059827]|uniref:3-deoxy-7-phosphoheptulonate synthase n=1 Tax=Kitasatospora sp. NPDC059827 TaxID=3346964 RepID=UPI003658AD02
MAVLLTYALSVPVVRIGPAPERGCEAAAVNLARAFIASTGLHHLHARNREFAAHSPAGARHRDLTRRIDSTLAFMRACGIGPAGPRSSTSGEFYTSRPHPGSAADRDAPAVRLTRSWRWSSG